MKHLAILGCLLFVGAARADSVVVRNPVTVLQPDGTQLHIACDSGCGGAVAFLDSASFTAAVSSINVSGGVFNDGLAALASGKAGAPRMTAYRAQHFNLRDNSGNEIPFPAALDADLGFKVHVQNTVTASISGSVAVTGTFWQATQPVSIASMPSTPVTGTFWQVTQPVSGPLTDTQLRATAVPVSGAVTATLSGSISNTTFASTQGTSPWVTSNASLVDELVAASANADERLTTRLTASAGLRIYDSAQTAGARLVPWTGTAAGGANVIVSTALPAGANVIGHVIHDSGSTTAVTGNVTVIQGTGSNLHAVLDTTSTTAVTQGTGSNLHAVIDTGSTTAVTQGTASNLNAQVVGAAANGSAASGNPVYVAGLGFNAIAFAPRYCDKIATVTTLSTTTTVQQIAAVANQKIYICGYYILASTATTAVTLKWSEGTGSNCVTGLANVTPAIFTTPTSAPTTANFTLGPFGGTAMPWMVTAGDALCITQSSGTNATTLSGVILYTQN